MIKILALHNDADFIRMILGGILKLVGFRFSGTTIKAEAVAQLQSGSIDLLIMNWTTSDDEYWEDFYDKLRANPMLNNMGIIVTSARGIGSKDIWSNGDCYLDTPFLVEDLLISVRRVLENYEKRLPSTETMQNQFEKQRDELKYELDWSNEKLEEMRMQILDKAGYT